MDAQEQNIKPGKIKSGRTPKQVCLFVGLLACIFIWLLACLLACLLVCLLACLFASVLSYSFVYWFACLLVCLLVCLFACLSACLSASLLSCLLTCFLVCFFLYLFACLLPCLLVCLFAYFLNCLLVGLLVSQPEDPLDACVRQSIFYYKQIMLGVLHTTQTTTWKITGHPTHFLLVIGSAGVPKGKQSAAPCFSRAPACQTVEQFRSRNQIP